MTAINAFVRDGRVEFMTDSLHRHPDGRAFAAPKVQYLLPLHAAVACRGVSLFLPVFCLALLDRCSSFDAAVVEMGSVLRDVAASPDAKLDVIMGGFSRTRGTPEIWAVSSYAENGSGAAAFEPVEAKFGIFAPSIEDRWDDNDPAFLARVAFEQALLLPNDVGLPWQHTVLTPEAATIRTIEPQATR